MKIWIQSANAIGKDPEVRTYEQSLKRHVQEVISPGTVIDIHGVDVTPPKLDRYYLSQHIVVSDLVKKAGQAQEEGYDAFVVTGTCDPGLREIREMLDIPAVFILETSIHLACMFASKFGFLTHSEALLLRAMERVKEYGLRERMTPGRSLNLTHKDFSTMWANPQPYVDAFIDEGRKVVEQGANILLVSGNQSNLFLFYHGVREIDGVPIMDICGTVVKFAEFMVTLNKMGMGGGRKGIDTAPSKEEIVTLLSFLR